MNESWQVEIFDASDVAQREKLVNYVKLGRVSFVHDTLVCQLTDFLRSENPRSKSTDCELIAAFLGDHRIESLTNYGVWVFYPWTGQLVRWKI